MKRLLFLSLLLLSGVSFADRVDQLTIFDYKIPGAVSTSSVTITAPGVGLMNCLTDLTVISDSTYTVTVNDAGTDVFSVLMPASTGLAKDWRIENPFCVSPNSALGIVVDNGTYSINYQGVVIKK